MQLLKIYVIFKKGTNEFCQYTIDKDMFELFV